MVKVWILQRKLALHIAKVNWPPDRQATLALTWTTLFLQVWYFGPNIGHAILGLKPAGCTYLAGECGHPHQHRQGISLLSPCVPLITIATVPY